MLLQTHHNQLTTTPAARSVLTELKDILYSRVKVSFDLFAAIYRQLCSNLMIIIPLSSGMQGYYRLQPCRNGSYKSMVPLLPACNFLLLFIFKWYNLVHSSFRNCWQWDQMHLSVTRKQNSWRSGRSCRNGQIGLTGMRKVKRRKRNHQEKVEPWAKGQSRTRMSFCWPLVLVTLVNEGAEFLTDECNQKNALT